MYSAVFKGIREGKQDEELCLLDEFIIKEY
jgi:hypothetical protein